jgi:hypothetical protein
MIPSFQYQVNVDNKEAGSLFMLHFQGGKAPVRNAQGIEAEILFVRPGRAKRLERKARFPALRAGNAPKKGQNLCV